MDEHSTEHSAKRRILLIEDHRDTADLVVLILQEAGYSVTHLRDADTALDFLSHECEQSHGCPDLVILDLTMAGKDPLEMVAEVGPEKMPPVIVMSARHSTSLAEAARRIGAVGIVPKPFNVHDLLLCIQQALP